MPAIEEFSSEKSHKTDEIRYYQNHLNGAPEELVDSAGNILWAENPTAWGQDQYDVDSIRKNTHQPLRFQGQYRDAESGLHYNTFRYYNPHCGRFINQDPIGLNGDQYAPNPISWIDPWGLKSGVLENSKFWKLLDGKTQRTKQIVKGARVFEITKKVDIPGLKKGDLFHLDTLHLNEIEIYDSRGNHKGVYDLNGKRINGPIPGRKC